MLVVAEVDSSSSSISSSVSSTKQPDHFCDYAICRVPNCKSQKHVRPTAEQISIEASDDDSTRLDGSLPISSYSVDQNVLGTK